MSNRPDRRRTRGRFAAPLAADSKSRRSSRAGQYEQVVAPNQQAIREAIEAGRCPWCGRGPFALLASHTNRQHGIDRWELRELAGLPYNAPVCDPAYSEKHRQIGKQRGGLPKVADAKPRAKPRISAAAREVLRRNGEARIAALTAEQRALGRQRAGITRAKQLKKPRQPCAVCGSPIPYRPGNTKQQTCGTPECVHKLRSARASEVRARNRSEFCKQGHPLSGDNLKIVKNGKGQSRGCRECQRRYQREYWAQKRATKGGPTS